MQKISAFQRKQSRKNNTKTAYIIAGKGLGNGQGRHWGFPIYSRARLIIQFRAFFVLTTITVFLI
ncbi:hypothetical protein bpr_IV171 (plasmid) [Butyrivibrio proteoclasticus B316]|uniref:Uncharacterized protein n=1 Tax=Butyrivibrio proteoclasticus (strain ATCC 51982 / DSM 14932 / B316) TaxID=515622 RepID=E0S553_BUTPB|nr:hypothetical protein bpr_IV171 [Butyrivibrio proteoclasticus B316]